MSGEGVKEYCGLFGIYGHPDAAQYTYLGLYALQHRGEESAGIVVSDLQQIRAHRGMGLVSDVFDTERLSRLPGQLAIGHVRYSTTGSSHLRNAQPLLDDVPHSSLAVAHNGNLVNAHRLRRDLEQQGVVFQTTVDSEIILHLMTKPLSRPFEDRVVDCVRRIQGAYSLVAMTEQSLIGVRDPHGFRPLCLGRVGDAYCLASETCAIDLVGGRFEREIEPGEIVFINGQGLRSIKPWANEPVRRAQCIFEQVYFARPDSIVFGDQVEEVRYRLGRELAKEHPVEADLVMPIPDSGNFAALGYSHESGIPYAMGMIRNHYIGRTFIRPSQADRDIKVRVKLNPIRSVLEGRRVVVVDDSIVRGTTSRWRLKSIREAGARAIHMRISCPPTRHPCHYGIDFPSRHELIAANNSIEEICEFIGADSLGYLSLDGLLRAVSGPAAHYCTACYSGDYPVPVDEQRGKFVLEHT